MRSDVVSERVKVTALFQLEFGFWRNGTQFTSSTAIGTIICCDFDINDLNDNDKNVNQTTCYSHTTFIEM
jgi:hypothetical protein